MPAARTDLKPCPTGDGLRHGTYSVYVNQKCRGMECTEANRAYARADRRRRRQDPEFRALEKERRDPEATRRATRTYLEKHPDHVKAWRRANPAASRAQVQRRRASLADVDHGCVTPEFLELIYSLPCAYCGAPCEHADHVHPVSRGGLHCVANIQPSCAHCNTSKNASILAVTPEPIRECEVTS